MEIFEKIGDAASKTYKFTTEKTSKIAKETKLKMQINEHKSDITDLYIEIGENVYEKFVKNEELDMSSLQEKCEMIQDLSDKIVACKHEILTLKEKRQCPNCFEEIDLKAKYCPNCGFEQEQAKTEEEQEELKEEIKEQKEENAENLRPQEAEKDEE